MIDQATHTGDGALIYKLSEELTPREAEKLLRLARAVKRREMTHVIVEMAYGKSGELYIVGLKRVA